MLSGIHERVESVIHHQHTLEEKAILEWLTPINYGPQQSDFLRRRQPGSGQWLLDSNEYQTWLKKSHQTLFCPGIPGAGKTILTAVVVNELFTQFQGNSDVGIAYIYCNFKRWGEQKAEHLLANLLKQLVQERCSLPDIVRALYEQHGKRQTRPSLNELSKVLQTVASLYSTTFIVIDALDECQVSDSCRDNFLSKIFSLQARCGAHIFANSRFSPDVTTKFKNAISIEIRATVDDVGRYIESRLSELPALKYATDSLQLQREIVTRILKAVDGM